MVQVRKSVLGYSIVMIYVRSFFCFFVCFIVQHGAGWKSLGSIGKQIPHHRLVWLRITKGRFGICRLLCLLRKISSSRFITWSLYMGISMEFLYLLELYSSSIGTSAMDLF